HPPGCDVLPELPRPAVAAGAGRPADRRRRRRQADSEEPAPGAHLGRGADRRDAPAADRVARRGSVGRARDERRDQLHQEDRVLDFSVLPLYLTEANVESLLTPADALEAVEGCFRRLAAGEVENRPRERLRLAGGAFAV